MAYESNRPYNSIQSNQPIQAVRDRPSKTEGAMWGALQGSMMPLAYSAGLHGVSKMNKSAVNAIDPRLGDYLEKTQKFIKNASDSKIDKHAKSESQAKAIKGGIKTGKGMTGMLFGTGLKYTAGRVASGAALGATQGAMHNASNGIISPY